MVNVIPVIPKADSFTPKELLRMKLDILNTAIERKIRFFDCAGAIDGIIGDVIILIVIIIVVPQRIKNSKGYSIELSII